MKKLYEADPLIHVQVKMILALAYVPEPLLRRYLDALKREIDQRLRSLLSYFEETYVGQFSSWRYGEYIKSLKVHSSELLSARIVEASR